MISTEIEEKGLAYASILLQEFTIMTLERKGAKTQRKHFRKFTVLHVGPSIPSSPNAPLYFGRKQNPTYDRL